MKLNLLNHINIARFSLVILLSVTIILTGCNSSTPVATREITVNNLQVTVAPPTPIPYVFKTSEPNSITVHGFLVVLDPMTILPAPDDAIYLVPLPVDQPISGIPQFEEGTVPQADVDESVGEFAFTNIQPGQYAVVARTKGGSQIPVREIDTGNYKIFTLDSSHIDTTYDLGRLTLP